MGANSLNGPIDLGVNMVRSNENFKFFTEIRETKSSENIQDDPQKQDLESHADDYVDAKQINNTGLKNPVFDANNASSGVQQATSSNDRCLSSEQPLLGGNLPSSDESNDINMSTFNNNNDDTNLSNLEAMGEKRTSFSTNKVKQR